MSPPGRGIAGASPGPVITGAPRRLAIAAALASAALLLAPGTPAHAGTVRVSQCNAVDQGGASPRGVQADLWSVANGWAAVDCGSGGGSIRVDTANHRLLHEHATDARFSLPGSMPHSALRTVWLDWTSMPQAPSANPAYLTVRGGGARLIDGPTGSGTAPGAAQRVDVPAGTRALSFSTWCSPLNGPGWCNWPAHLLELRGLTAELEESADPSAAAGGALAAGGAHAGVEPLELAASDADTGVRRVAVTLGGVAVGALEPAGGCRDDRLPPCPQAVHGTIDVDTRRVPDGPQRLRLVVTDAAGNARTVDAGPVTIANQPQVDTPTPPGPAPGGPGGWDLPGGPGGWSPPAEWPLPVSPPRRTGPFPPNPLAGRGHVPNGTNASKRARVSAWLELPQRGGRVIRRRATTVPRGVRVRIRGRVRNRRGRPIGGATLAAYAREPGDVRRPITGVRTRPNGRFTAFTRIGPSRTVRFVYYAYGDSTRGSRSPALRVTVRAR